MTIWASNKNSYTTLNESFELLKLTLFMHRPFSHVNMSSPHGCGVAQWCSVTFSSAPSTQSGSPSHILREITANRQHIFSMSTKKILNIYHFFGIHCDLPQDLFSSHVNSVSSSHFRLSMETRILLACKKSIWTTIIFNECKEILTALMPVIFIAVVQTI